MNCQCGSRRLAFGSISLAGGASGAAAVIEQKAREQGSTLHTETVQDRAARLQRAMDYESKRRSFLASVEGVNAANNEARKLSDELQALVAEESMRSIGIQHKRDNLYTVILKGRLGLYPYPAKAGCPTVAGGRWTRAAPAGMAPAVSWS